MFLIRRLSPPVLVFICGFLTACDSGSRTGQGGAQAAPDGSQVYATSCQNCHQPEGRGLPGSFPPLAGSEWVNGPSNRLIALVLDGIQGPQEVKGHTYMGTMPGWRSAMSDAQISAVLTYVRQDWGNTGSPITTPEVASIRAAMASRKAFWTAADLKALPDTAPATDK